MKKRSVWITGMGVVCPKAKNCNEFSKMLQKGESCVVKRCNSIREIPQLEIGAFFQDFSLKDYMKQNNIPEALFKKVVSVCRRQPINVQATAAAAIEAALQADFLGNVNPEDISVLVAGSNLQQEMQAGTIQKYKDSKYFMPPNYASNYWDTSIMGIISEIFNIQGEGYTIGGASASGNAAIIEAFRKIQSEDAEICIVIGPMAGLSEFELCSFANIGALGGINYQTEPEKASRPFDKKHEGFIYGQGAACIVLESSESALKRSSAGIAQILGGAIKLDGNHLTNASVNGEAAVIKKALENAKVKTDEVDYINAHGTSTPAGDYAELEAIEAVFKNRKPKINSTKCLIGHCLCSAGIIEAVAVVIQMKKSFIHANINLFEPIRDDMNLVGISNLEDKINVALSNSFGFAGINTAVVFKDKE